MSKRNAEKDSKITFCLKCKSIFSDKAKKRIRRETQRSEDIAAKI